MSEITKKFGPRLKRLILELESPERPLIYYIISFVFFLSLRILLEKFSNPSHLKVEDVFHIFLFFMASFSILLSLTSAFSGSSPQKVARLICGLSPMILLPPLIDLLPFLPEQQPMGYIRIQSLEEAVSAYFSLGGNQGMTIGIKVEVISILISSFIYLRIKGQSIVKSLLYIFVVYTYLFSLGIIPAILGEFYPLMGIPAHHVSEIEILNPFFGLIIMINICLILIRTNGEIWAVLRSDIRAIRIVHYVLMIALGLAILKYENTEKKQLFSAVLEQESKLTELKNELALAYQLPEHNEQKIIGLQKQKGELIRQIQENKNLPILKEKAPPLPYLISRRGVMCIPLILISLIFCAIFAIVINNIEDLEIDKISNPNRPLVQGIIPTEVYFKAGLICQGLGLLAAAFTGYIGFWFILLISFGYFVYSAPPFRLKRIPILAKFVLALNSFFMVLMGFLLLGGQLAEFPKEFTFFLLIPTALAGNFLDIKDLEGDKKGKIYTLPVLLGDRMARVLITIFTFTTYFCLWWIVPIKGLGFILFPAYLLHAVFLNLQPYREKLVFITYLSALFGLILLLFNSNLIKSILS